MVNINHGITMVNYGNGQLKEECTYLNGKKHGEYKLWHDNGQLWKEYTYVNGELV